jgi:glycosyltransferase involved in cell wall biosynthesis
VTAGKFSIVIPTYNSAPLLARALNSVLEQTYSDWEVFVIDNHSADDTDAVVNSFGDARIRLLKTHNHGVIAKSRNIGIRQATGRWVAFLDADDWWTSTKLEYSLLVLKAGADVVYHDLWRVSPRSIWGKRIIRSRHLQPPILQDLYWNGNGLLNSSVVVSRDLLYSVGSLNEAPALVGAEDFEYWLRLARQSDNFVKLPGIHGNYWVGTGNISNPSRAITWLTELTKLEHKPTRGIDKEEPLWMTFALAKANYQLGRLSVARMETEKLLRMDTPFIMKVKVIFLLLFIWSASRSK